MSLKHWVNVTVKLNDNWGSGADHSLSTPMRKQPEFSLRPRYLRDSDDEAQLAYFTVDFPSGYLNDGWQGANFVPLGKHSLKGISGLPAYSQSTRQTYRDKIEAVADALDSSTTLRLEGVVSHITTQGEIGYNRVKLFYVRKAVAKGPNHDLVIVRINHHPSAPGPVRGSQNGNGQGPPH